MKNRLIVYGVFAMVFLIMLVSFKNGVTLDTVFIPAITLRQLLNILLGAFGFALFLLLAIPTYARTRSRRRCKKAFIRISEWTQRNQVERTNADYYRQMAREVKILARNHLKMYPEDKEHPALRMYLDYTVDAFELAKQIAE